MENIEQSLYDDLLYAQSERAEGFAGRSAEDVLADMDAILASYEYSLPIYK